MTAGPAEIHISGVSGIPEIASGDDVARLIADAALAEGGPGLRAGDILVVTSKVVSKAEGRVVSATREDAIAAETVRVVARRGQTTIAQTRQGFVLAAAGVDESNTAPGTVVLLPEDPDESARRLRKALRARLGVAVGVIVTDTMGRPWRAGQTDTAIGAAGVLPLRDHRGEPDTFGNTLEVTVAAVADEIAAAATWSRARRCRYLSRSCAASPRWSPIPTGQARGRWSVPRTRTCSGSAPPTCCRPAARSGRSPASLSTSPRSNGRSPPR